MNRNKLLNKHKGSERVFNGIVQIKLSYYNLSNYDRN